MEVCVCVRGGAGGGWNKRGWKILQNFIKGGGGGIKGGWG